MTEPSPGRNMAVGGGMGCLPSPGIGWYRRKLDIPAGFIPGNADADCSGSIGIVDALIIARYYVGLIPEFPC